MRLLISSLLIALLFTGCDSDNAGDELADGGEVTFDPTGTWGSAANAVLGDEGDFSVDVVGGGGTLEGVGVVRVPHEIYAAQWYDFAVEVAGTYTDERVRMVMTSGNRSADLVVDLTDCSDVIAWACRGRFTGSLGRNATLTVHIPH